MNSTTTRILVHSLALGALVFVASGCATAWKHPDFMSAQATMTDVALLPPDISIHRLTFKGDEEYLADKTELARALALDAISEILKERGYGVRRVSLEGRADEDLERMQAAVGKMWARYDAMHQQLRKRKPNIFTFESSANIFADEADTDHLLLVRGVGFEKSAGQFAKDFVGSVLVGAASFGSYIPQPTTGSLSIDIAVVDGNSGDILWHNFWEGPASHFSSEKSIKGCVGSILRPFPKALANPVGKKDIGAMPKKH